MTPHNPSNDASNDDPSPIDHRQAHQAQQDGATLIDVREPDEWKAGHIQDARHVPLGDIANDPDVGMDADTPIVTYCKSGGRAERAADLLQASGYTNVRYMTGGFGDWKNAGYPTDKP